MPAKTLIEKLKMKPGSWAAVLNAPGGYLESLPSLPPNTTLHTRLAGRYDWIQLFVKDAAELEQQAPAAIAALKPTSLLWLTFPKGASKIQTDLTRDKGWESLAQFDLKWVNLVSVNETWSAFCLRPYQPGEARQSFR